MPDGALSALQRSVTERVAASSAITLRASAFSATKRHPGAASAIERGESYTTSMTFAYIDLTEFTRRTFWEDHRSVVALGDAVVGGFADMAHAFGGHVLGLRGDGLIAGFEGSSKSSKAVALVATATSLLTVEGPINGWLASQGKEGLKAKAGIDHGEVTFLPVAGTEDYNMLGFALNFAAKCEKEAAAWGIVAGESYVGDFAPAQIASPHKKSPKTYTMHGTSRQYRALGTSGRAGARRVMVRG